MKRALLRTLLIMGGLVLGLLPVMWQLERSLSPDDPPAVASAEPGRFEQLTSLFTVILPDSSLGCVSFSLLFGIVPLYLIWRLWQRAYLGDASEPVANSQPVRIRVTELPPGDIREELRQVWVGMILPVELDGQSGLVGPAVDVFTGETAETLSGYAVNLQEAVRLLDRRDPQAADWWRKQAGSVFGPRSQLVFPHDSVTLVLEQELLEGERVPVELLDDSHKKCGQCGAVATRLAVRCKNCRGVFLEPQAGETSTVPEQTLSTKQPPSTETTPTIIAPAKPAGMPKQIGSFDLLQELGQGAMGAVYLARHRHLKKLAAVKLIREDKITDGEILLRFQQEMELAGRVEHEHVVRALDAGENGGVHFLAMEFVSGWTLTQVQTLASPLSAGVVAEIGRQVALALGAVEACGMVHRDLKPSNLMLSEQGLVKLLDLGLARLKYHDPQMSVMSQELTLSQQILGTIDYMSPEQIQDARSVDIRADLYSLGCTLFKLLTGEAPYARDPSLPPMGRLLAHVTYPVPSVRAYRPDCTPELELIITRLLAKQREDRYQAPAELAAALSPLAAGETLAQLLAFLRNPGSIPQGTPSTELTGTTHPVEQ